MPKDDSKPYTTKPTTQVDLERRLADGNRSEAEVGRTITVNPNPFGEESFVGTDPIYQNYSTDAGKPFDAEKGAEKKAEDEVKDLYDLEGVDERSVVADYGFGGKAVRAKISGPGVSDVVVGGSDVKHVRAESAKDEGAKGEDEGEKDDGQDPLVPSGTQPRQTPTQPGLDKTNPPTPPTQPTS